MAFSGDIKMEKSRISQIYVIPTQKLHCNELIQGNPWLELVQSQVSESTRDMISYTSEYVCKSMGVSSVEGKYNARYCK